MVSVKVYCMKINWYSTHHRIVYSQYHCKSVTNILAKPIFVCRNSTLNRSHYTMWKICAPTAFRRMKNANDNRMLWKTKRADHQIYLIEKFGSTQHRKLHALMYLILFFSKTDCFFFTVLNDKIAYLVHMKFLMLDWLTVRIENKHRLGIIRHPFRWIQIQISIETDRFACQHQNLVFPNPNWP